MLLPPDFLLASETLISPVAQNPVDNLCTETETNTGYISPFEHSEIQPSLVVNESNTSLCPPVEDELSSNESVLMLTEDHQIPLNVPRLPPDLLLTSKSHLWHSIQQKICVQRELNLGPYRLMSIHRFSQML